MNKDNNQLIFYGFVVGSVLLLMPVPSFFFWEDFIDQIETIFRYLGFVLFTVCGITIIIKVVREFFGK